MTAAETKAAIASKKRANSDGENGRAKKKSPLFDKPQNYYAPPSIASMTREELSAWRKDQRRKRNRDSAAASRNRTRSRIQELEGEVGKWKSMYAEMEKKIRCMERHIQFLTRMRDAPQSRKVAVAPPSPSIVVSHSNRLESTPSMQHTSGVEDDGKFLELLVGFENKSNGALLNPMAMVASPNTVTSSMAMPPPPPYSSHSACSNKVESESSSATSDEASAETFEMSDEERSQCVAGCEVIEQGIVHMLESTSSMAYDEEFLDSIVNAFDGESDLDLLM